jgi:hypothetical protein
MRFWEQALLDENPLYRKLHSESEADEGADIWALESGDRFSNP